uniref:Uncharacterized protein n=1 Tax=Salvator merianae TaxID=96440 RepID=A0A8D0CBB7_SALMN
MIRHGKMAIQISLSCPKSDDFLSGKGVQNERLSDAVSNFFDTLCLSLEPQIHPRVALLPCLITPFVCRKVYVEALGNMTNEILLPKYPSTSTTITR